MDDFLLSDCNDQSCRSTMEMPSSFSEDDETAETSSSVD